ncbi:MAG TPA: tetratricopeptide repeat-containing protein [Pyrinomonadaceae bacterium]
MRAFIVRPFGLKNDIDFDAVEANLIGPALDKLGVTGRTTGEIVGQGNIRTDMFQLLLTADLVVADLSIHNANVFYELGIRHALRDRHTFLLRCNVDRYPFDLQTDRYFTYKKEAPADSVDALAAALRATIDEGKTNSPVFASLPNMKEQDPSEFMAVPAGFGEEVERAASERRLGDLGLLAAEAKGFYWETEGLRAVGRAQYEAKDFKGAKNTWETLRRTSREYDLEANLLLGTIYERLGKITDSNLSLDRALDNKEIGKDKRAEAYALQGRNAKTLWRREWETVADAAAKPAAALKSGLLQDSFESYERAFEEDLNHFYSGLNALAMLRVMIELATAQPNAWAGRFKTRKKAEDQLSECSEHAAQLAAAVEVSLNASIHHLEREGKKNSWVDISLADLRLLTSDNPDWVVSGYRDALDAATDQAKESVRNQLAMYKDLGVFKANVDEVINYTGLPEAKADENGRKRVLIFTGHMIDAPGRAKPRFPADKEAIARQKIKEAVEAEMKIGDGVAFGIAGGASGGDILFQEVCFELGIPTHLYLALPSGLYVNASVRKAGPDWVQRFRDLFTRHTNQGLVRVLSELDDEPKDEKEYLPAWLRSKPNYNIWQRNNLWMLYNALTAGGDDSVTLISLWDCEPTGDGPGGTSDLVQKVERRGAKAIIINTKTEFGL